MPNLPFDQRIQVEVELKGHPKKVVLPDIKSVMEIPDEENEQLKGISFHDHGTWHDFKPSDFDTITIRKLPRSIK